MKITEKIKAKWELFKTNKIVKIIIAIYKAINKFRKYALAGELTSLGTALILAFYMKWIALILIVWSSILVTTSLCELASNARKVK